MGMFIGAYWPQRKESQAEVADRLVRFLRTIGNIDPIYSQWFLKAGRKSAANKPVVAEPAEVAAMLKVNRRDVDGDAIAELGFSFGCWNGVHASFSATVGAFSPHVQNSVVLSVGDSWDRGELKAYRRLLEAVVGAFNPQHAVVTSTELLDQANAAVPWEAGWLIYHVEGGIQEHVSM
jgi:hypothetical protein